MKFMLKHICWLFLIGSVVGEISNLVNELEDRKDLEELMVDILNVVVSRHDDVTCVTVICDPVYLNVFDGPLFKRTYAVPIIMIVVAEHEDLLSPNFLTLEALRQSRKDGCNLYVILLANGIQTSRLLKFGDRHRILDTRAKYFMLHDYRLFTSELHYIWKRIVNVIFLKYHTKIAGANKSKAWFDLSTVPFPNPIRGVFVSKRIDIWRNGRFQYNRKLFEDKTNNLNGETLNVVYLDHIPSVVVKRSENDTEISGVEIEILQTLAEKMNFIPKLYQPVNAELHRWGQVQANGSFSGLLGEMVQGKADVALGNLQYTPYHLELTDLSIPYISQCLTFLTPEALTDNSWKTLILPFKLYMWIAVLLVLLITGAIFYGLSQYYQNLYNYKQHDVMSSRGEKVEYEITKPEGLYLFGEIINSILYTYGMLLVVSLPKLPSGTSIQLLTGWYWLYCILLVVSYKASLTAILANPTPRVTIDTLKELTDSKVTCGGWGLETKKFFLNSQDDMTRKIGEKFETVNDPDVAAKKVAQGVYAYYDNVYFLKYLTVKRKNASSLVTDINENSTMSNITEVQDGSERNLHIMLDCVVNIPVSIGFQKNSPLKPLADIYLRRIVEVGLVEKWLNDAMHPITALGSEEAEIKALMNLKKLYGAFVALAIGYFLSLLSLMCEIIYWNFIVKRDPNFDKYALDIYYSSKNKKQY